MLKNEQELEALLNKLSEWKKKRDRKNVWKRKYRDNWFEDKKLGLKILEDFSHSGVTEWTEALRWVLDKKRRKEPKR